MRHILIYCISIIVCIPFTGCMENYLDLYPKDKITSADFPEGESDIILLLNGVYGGLRESAIYNEGLFGFGVTDGATPNAYNWGTAEIINKLGAGRLSSGDKGIVTFRWTKCYEIISRENFLLANLDLVNLPEEKKKMYLGETHFLRGLAYSVLAETYAEEQRISGIRSQIG